MPAVVRVQVGLIRIGRPVLNPLVVRGYAARAVAPPELGVMLGDGETDFRIFAGQPDANDASRFKIGYELNGVRGVIDGQLDSQDQVILTPRDGAVLPGARFPVWQPAASRAPRATPADALKWPN